MPCPFTLFLRAPPHVEFVQGFPGIPPHLGRPPANVRGVVELRSSERSAKARWVKIELRKIETLPGGGQSNTYFDIVGESPVTLWQAQNEWDEIRSQDLCFQIRVPESVPPSLALERSAGIKYELVASMLAKGKKGLLWREAPQIITASCQIVIDKHELHSVWPMYSRPESRSKMFDGYTLTVNRTHQAYGPGDRIAVQTLVKNDTAQVNQVRYYEFSLREHVMYKPAGNQNGTRKMMTQPQTRTRAIVEQRIPITMVSPLHPGMQAKVELSLQVPFNQTTMTVIFAHRIEVQFVIHVRAVLATGLQLLLDLPITMSNWTRAHSIDVVRQIGPAPPLSSPGGVPGPVYVSSAGHEPPVASPPRGNPQPQIGWPSNRGAEPTYLDSWPMTAGSPFNHMTPLDPPPFPPPHSLLNGSTPPAARSPAPLPSSPVATNPQPMMAGQEIAMLKGRYAVDNAAQNGWSPPALPPSTSKRDRFMATPVSSSRVDKHQSPPPADFFPSDRETPLPSSFSSVTKPSTPPRRMPNQGQVRKLKRQEIQVPAVLLQVNSPGSRQTGTLRKITGRRR